MRAWAWWVALAVTAARGRELDPGACAARFDVQRDKIIRTEESRDMGARYLAELDVGSRAECLRLCCETDACDVFVFEEKSPGSCYLFKCGPPEDFRCKFTAHGNFSSGVLALSRRLAELQDQERLAHHERELAGLRSPASTSSAQPPPPPPPPQQSQQPRPVPGRCSRYQFECRRGGECIAVYNACDGVPQCADGSDEAPELGCPAPPGTPPAPPPHAQVLEGVEGEAAEPGAGELWPRRLTQAQRRYPGAADGTGDAGGASAAGGGARSGTGGAPHIFSHQGGLMQPAAFAPAWPRHAWPPDRQNEVDNMEAVGGVGGWGYSRLEAWPDERRAWPVPPRLEPELPAYAAPKTMPELPLYSAQRQEVTLSDAPKKGFELRAPSTPASTPPPEPVRPPPARPQNTTKKKALVDSAEVRAVERVAERVAERAEEHAAARAGWPEERDGPSERPPAAVLLLVLGSLLTAALGALLACRARAARRRRRAHPRLALDADYLVNGMYL
ncbi:uncharacterized protein [Battus philenor]|uniref:uncharacterized protein n=1 Tax=Battus philenor TaxID=42288 RepID=UPI0035CFDDBE